MAGPVVVIKVLPTIMRHEKLISGVFDSYGQHCRRDTVIFFFIRHWLLVSQVALFVCLHIRIVASGGNYMHCTLTTFIDIN